MQMYTLFDFQKGIDGSKEAPFIPNDAFTSLINVYIRRFFLNMREGYIQYATGGQGGAPICESRIVARITNEAVDTGDGGMAYSGTLLNIPVRRGTLTITDAVGVQSVTDDGLGILSGNGTGTINYTTGDWTVTFTNNVGIGDPITATYDYHPGLPVMMIANFYTDTQIRELIVADTRNVNKYNSTTNRLDNLTRATTYTGNATNFWHWVNYPDASDNNRLLFTNNKDTIQYYPNAGNVGNYAFTLAGVAALSCLRIHQFKDRLILLNTLEDGTRFAKRIRISGYGSNADIFDTTAPGAGSIELPDDSDIVSSWLNRDDLLIMTNRSLWNLKYTGNDVVPFELQKVDGTRGADAPFGTNDYLNVTSYISRRGLFATDGYRVQAADELIPEFVYNDIDASGIGQCFAGKEDEDTNNYLLYPSFDNTESPAKSDLILVTNYENGAHSIYDIALSCIGQYKESFNITWADLSIFNDWESLSAEFNDWNAFSYMLDSELTIGGGHEGQIWRMNKGDGVDNNVRIRGISKATSAVITTDFNNYTVGDKVYITGVLGMVDINEMVGTIIAQSDNSITVNIASTNFETYTADSGTVSRVIPLDIQTKQFNPYFEQGLGIRVGWGKIYYSVVGKTTYDKIIRPITDIDLTDGVVTVTSPGSNFKTGESLYIYDVAGTTEINNIEYTITRVDIDSFTLNNTDGTTWTPYTSGGKIKLRKNSYLNCQIKTSDYQDFASNQFGQTVQLQTQMNNRPGNNQTKMWKNFPINAAGNYIQLDFTNDVPLANVRIYAIQINMQPSRRLKDS